MTFPRKRATSLSRDRFNELLSCIPIALAQDQLEAIIRENVPAET